MNIIALDVGGTAIKHAYFQEGTLVIHSECPSHSHLGGARLVEVMKTVIHSYLEKYPADVIGISSTAQVDVKTGSILYSNDTIPNYTGMKIKEILEAEFCLPVFVENDVNAAAIGEAVYGAGQNQKDFLMVTYGTGIGGAIFVDGHLFKGANQAAGEFGRMRIHPEESSYGAEGCYEAYASTTALVKKASLSNPEFRNGKVLFEAFHNNDREAGILIDDWIQEISYGLINLIYIFNPSCIILGGGIMSQQYILQKLNRIMEEYIIDSFKSVKLVSAKLDNLAGVYGMRAICDGSYKYI